MSTISPVSDDLIDGKTEVLDISTRIKVPLARLKWDFSVIARLLNVGENSKVFKFRGDGKKCYIEAATSVYFRDCLGPCSEVLDYMVAFVDITPILEDGKEVIITFESSTVSFDVGNVSASLHHTYGALPDMELENYQFTEMKETEAYARALRTLNSPTVLKNSFAASANCYFKDDRVVSTYPICWIECVIPNEGFSQVVQLAFTPLLLHFFSHVKVQYHQGERYFILKYKDAYLAIPRHVGTPVDFSTFTSSKVPVCCFRPDIVVPTLKSVMSFEKVSFVTLYVRDNFLSIFTEASSCTIHKQFPVTHTAPSTEYVFTCQSDFLLACLSLFKAEEVTLSQCFMQQKRMMILTSTSTQLILSLRS